MLIRIILILFVGVSCTKKNNSQTKQDTQPEAQVQQQKKACKNECGDFDKQLCKSLVSEEARCKTAKNEETCKGFVRIFTMALAAKVSCTNTCGDGDKWERPVAQACDDLETEFPKIAERAGYLLPQLKFPYAQQLLVSKKFEVLIDGAMGDLKEAVATAKKELGQ